MNNFDPKNLKIDHPCPMLLARLQNEEDGQNYCKSCQKNVVDFRDCSAEEIAEYLQTHPNSCGIFYEEQLPGQAQVRHTPLYQIAFKVMMAASFFGFAVSPLQAQNTLTELIPAEDKLQIKEKPPTKELKQGKTAINSDEELKEAPSLSKREQRKEEKAARKAHRSVRRKRLFRRRLMGCPSF